MVLEDSNCFRNIDNIFLIYSHYIDLKITVRLHNIEATIFTYEQENNNLLFFGFLL